MARRKRQPFDPGKVHDRRAGTGDLTRGAQTAAIEVDDPYAIDPGGKIVTLRSVRNDPLAGLHSRGFIDDAQYLGGRDFQRDFEAAERGPQAIDPSKEAVDGGKMADPLSDARMRASERLKSAFKRLGLNNSALTTNVLIDRMTIDQICKVRGLTSQRDNDFVGRLVRECLNDLGKEYGYVMETSPA